MKILIEYESCWQTGFLSDDNKKPITKKHIESRKVNTHASDGYMQKFVATSKARGERPTPISDSTVMGVLCRLIGDQRKLSQAKNSDSYYFNNIEKKISWRLINNETVDELVYLTNKSDSRCGQSSWLGVLPDDNPWFFSDVAALFWSVIFLDRDEILNFIISDKYCQNNSVNIGFCKPKELIKRLEIIADSSQPEGAVWKSLEKSIAEIDKLNLIFNELEKKYNIHLELAKEKPPKTEKQNLSFSKKSADFETKLNKVKYEIEVIGSDGNFKENDRKLNAVIDKLESIFEGNAYWSNGIVYPMSLYSAALYLQAMRMIENGINLDFMLNHKGDVKIQGFSKRGFNGVRDWLNQMSGGRKKAVGTPCHIQKQMGFLEVNLDVCRDKALEIECLIENAGVSSFYLGKKGLAYVSKIRI